MVLLIKGEEYQYVRKAWPKNAMVHIFNTIFDTHTYIHFEVANYNKGGEK